MHKSTRAHILDEFASADYKKTLIMDDNKYKESRPYKEDAVLESRRTSDYKANYIWKFGNPDEIRNVSIKEEIQFMKPFHECNLKFIKRPMRPPTSVTHSDYLLQPKLAILYPEPLHIPAAVFSTKVVIDFNKPGYSKYLDPAATTTSLDYCYRSPQDIMSGIAAKDNITFWNWKDIEFRDKNVFRVKDAQLCDKLPSKECTQRRCEFPTRIKPVPNSGLTTEVRDNYVAEFCFSNTQLELSK